MKCLIVEDNLTERRLLEVLLGKWGSCEVTDNGPAAIAAVEKSLREGTPFDLISLDIQLPNGDGQSILKAVRRAEKELGEALAHESKIIMSTMLHDSSNVLGAFREQCDGYLVKPVDPEKLLALLKELRLIEMADPTRRAVGPRPSGRGVS